MTPLPRYPGRGLVVGRDADGLFWLYFVTGRSPASKARRLESGPRALAVVATSADAVPDDLRYYDCVVALPACTVVGNGSHVTDIAHALDAGTEFGTAFSGIEPEPDPPLFTPRIVAAFVNEEVWIGGVRRDDGRSVRSVRSMKLQPGEGWMLYTYTSAGESVEPSGVPHPIEASERHDLLEQIWAGLDPAFRVLAAIGPDGSAVPTTEILSRKPPI